MPPKSAQGPRVASAKGQARAPKRKPGPAAAKAKPAAAKSDGPKEPTETDVAIERLFNLSDHNGSGSLEFGEFLLHHRNIMSATDFACASDVDDREMEQKFREHDEDHNQRLDKEEFKAYMDGVYSLLGKRKFLDICTGLINEMVTRLELRKGAYNDVISAQLVEKARKMNFFLPELEMAATQMLEKRADPTFVDSDGGHILLYAADKAKGSFIRLLLEFRADPSKHSKDMDCAAFRAARSRNVDALSLLLLPDGQRPTPDAEAAEKFKASQSMVRKMSELTGPDVSALLKKGADINFKDDSGWTPLTAAVFWGKLDCLEALLKTQTMNTKAAVRLRYEAKNGRGRAALHIAARKDRVDMIPLILRAKCDVDMQDTDGWTALHHAAFNCADQSILKLVESSANLLIQGRNGNTPYMISKMPSQATNLGEKAQKALTPPEGVNFSKIVIPVLKDEQTTLYEKIETLLSLPGVCQLASQLRMYEQLFDARHGPNKVRLLKLWEGLMLPIIRRLHTGDVDLPLPTADMSEEARQERLQLIRDRQKEQCAFLKQTFWDTKGPRPNDDWKYVNRESYSEEMEKALAEELQLFREELNKLYLAMAQTDDGELLVQMPPVEEMRSGYTSQLLVHTIPLWLQEFDPAGAFEALRSVGAAGMGVKDDGDAILNFTDLVGTSFDFDDGSLFWRNVYRTWLQAYAKLADSEFQRRVQTLANTFNEDHHNDQSLQVTFVGAAPKTYDRIKAKEAQFGESAHDTYEGRTIAANVLDIIRCSISVTCPRAAIMLLEGVFKKVTLKRGGLELLRVENRFSEGADTEPSKGYRNMEMHLLVDCGQRSDVAGRTGCHIPLTIIAEVQIVLEEFAQVQERRQLLFMLSRGDFDWNTEDTDQHKGADLDEEEDEGEFVATLSAS